jgi:hypothetical protein
MINGDLTFAPNTLEFGPGNGGTLQIDGTNPQSIPTYTINGFAIGDQIDFINQPDLDLSAGRNERGALRPSAEAC